jgi:hypothetical protein
MYLKKSCLSISLIHSVLDLLLPNCTHHLLLLKLSWSGPRPVSLVSMVLAATTLPDCMHPSLIRGTNSVFLSDSSQLVPDEVWSWWSVRFPQVLAGQGAGGFTSPPQLPIYRYIEEFLRLSLRVLNTLTK